MTDEKTFLPTNLEKKHLRNVYGALAMCDAEIERLEPALKRSKMMEAQREHAKADLAEVLADAAKRPEIGVIVQYDPERELFVAVVLPQT